MLRRNLRVEAEELVLAINTIKDEHSKCCHEAKCEHGQLLREERQRLAKQHETKERQINALTDSLTEAGELPFCR